MKAFENKASAFLLETGNLAHLFINTSVSGKSMSDFFFSFILVKL